MTAPIAYGIDFGTTNSLVTAAYPDRVDLLAAEGTRELLPSVVYLHRDGIELAGEHAIKTYSAAASLTTHCGRCELADWTGKGFDSDCRFAKEGGRCHNARLIVELKSFLSDEDLESTHSWGRDFSLPGLTSVVIRSLKRRADQITGTDLRKAVIGHPVAFAGTEGPHYRRRQQLAVERLKRAAFEAGFEELELLEEPSAAVSDEDSDGIVVALDFGGGTFDVVVIEMQPERGIVRSMQGVAVGGEDFDEALFRKKLWPALGLDGREVSHRLRMDVSRRGTALRVLSNGDRMWDLSRLPGARILKAIFRGGHVYALFEALEQAKISLSTKQSTSIRFDRPGVDIDVQVTRTEFERTIANDLDLVCKQIDRALDRAGVRARDVDLVVRTGGSSSIPAFIDRIEDRFGADRVVQREPYSSIAMGLGFHARKIWG